MANKKDSVHTQATAFEADDFLRGVKNRGTTPDTQIFSRAVLKTYFDTLYAAIGAGGGELNNYLINGGFDFAQRQIPGTLTTYAANTYSVDRWKTYAENASYQYQRQDGLGETGLTSQYFGAFKKITSAGKMFHYQIVEGVNSAALRGKTVIFQCQMKASSAKTIRMGVFELVTAGTIDSVPSPIVTAAGANSTDPTMGTNVAIITAAQSKSVTTAMQTFSVSVTVPATSKNLICAVWTDSQFAANDILYIAEAGLYVSATAQAWKPRLLTTELAMCQRFCWALQQADASGGNLLLSNVYNYTTTNARGVMVLPVTMRGKPTIAVTTIGNWYVQTTANFTASALSIIGGDNHVLWISVTMAAATAGHAGVFGTSTASEEITLDAEL